MRAKKPKWDERIGFLFRLFCFQVVALCTWAAEVSYGERPEVSLSVRIRGTCCEPVAAETDSGARWRTLNAVSLAPVSLRATDSWWELSRLKGGR